MKKECILIFLTSFSFAKANTSQETRIAQEIHRVIQQQKKDLERYAPLGIYKAQKMLTEINKTKAFEERKFSTFNRFMVHKTLQVFDDVGFPLIYLHRDNAPHVVDLIKSLCDKLALPLPLILLANDDRFVNMLSASLTQTASLLIISKPLALHLSKNLFLAGIAHELGHILKRHDIKQLLFSWGSSALLIASVIAAAKTTHSQVKNMHKGVAMAIELPLILGTAAAGFAGMLRLSSFLSRRFEHQADDVAKKVMKNPRIIRLFLKRLDLVDELSFLEYQKARNSLKAKIATEFGYKPKLEKKLIDELFDRESWWGRIKRKLRGHTHPHDEER